MLKLPLYGIIMLASLSLICLSVFIQLPFIVIVGIFWCAWLCFVSQGWKRRVLALFGFLMMPLGWWLCFPVWDHFARIGEASHSNEASVYWATMANTGFWIGIGLMIIGVMLLTWLGYRREVGIKTNRSAIPETQSNPCTVWPPAPKPPQ